MAVRAWSYALFILFGLTTCKPSQKISFEEKLEKLFRRVNAKSIQGISPATRFKRRKNKCRSYDFIIVRVDHSSYAL